MKHIKNFDDFLFEKKVQIKRKWGQYSSKNISTAAKVRNAVFSAIGDGIITEEELKKVLTELGANKRWLSRNKNLFIVSEEDGIFSYGLSKYGKKIFDTISLEENIHLNPNANVQTIGNPTIPGDPSTANSFSTQTIGSGDIVDLIDREEDEDEEDEEE